VTPEKIQYSISYSDTGSWLHRLNGITKFSWFIAWVAAVMLTFDLRLIAVFVAVGLWLLQQTRVPLRVYRPLMLGTLVVLGINAAFMYLLAPGQGAQLMGSETVLLSLPAGYSITRENLFYLLTVTLKYFSMFPIALVFVFCTQPTEFAASLHRLGVPYRIAYAVSLTLRYLPDVKNDFVHILQAQQARGVDISRKVPLLQRMRNLVHILGPLLFTSLERADTVANAMVLRGFGRARSRTWYCARPLSRRDWLAIGLALAMVTFLVWHRWAVGAVFWYPWRG
jgi:energy-coupling factor transport system permease protein